MTMTNEARAAAKAELNQQLLKKRALQGVRTHRAETAIVASDEDIIAEFAALPLPMRMRSAADVLSDVNERSQNVSYATWNAVTLLDQANAWERDDRGRETAVEELAVDLYNLTDGTDTTLPACRDLARALVIVGWTKGGTDDESA